MTEESSSSKTPQVALATATESPEIKDPRAAQLSAAGHWGETQVIERVLELGDRLLHTHVALLGFLSELGQLWALTFGEGVDLFEETLKAALELVLFHVCFPFWIGCLPTR